MFLKRIRASSFFYSPLPYRYFSTSSTVHYKPIDVTVRKDLLSLTLTLSGERPINFFISPSFSFKALKESILAQYPHVDFQYDFSASKEIKVDEDTNVFDFLNSKTKGQVVLNINEDNFLLKNTMAENLSQIVNPFFGGSLSDPHCVTHWYGKCVDNKMQVSHAGTLAYFLRNLSGQLEKCKGKLSEKELDNIMSKAVVFGREPTLKKLEECYHELNIVSSQIEELESEKVSIENRAERRINLYLKLLLLASIGQFVSFYYMIFHVDWLGWDIIEPITYTVQCLTVVFGIRFYMKYGLGRELQTMKEINRNKMINANKLMKARYQVVCHQLAYKQAQRDLLIQQRDLFLNRRNYYQFFFTPTQHFDVRETA